MIKGYLSAVPHYRGIRRVPTSDTGRLLNPSRAVNPVANPAALVL